MKIALRSYANDKIVCADDGPSPERPLVANRDAIGGWETFELLVQQADGSWVPFEPSAPPTPEPPEPIPEPPTPGIDAIDLAAAIVASPDCPPVAGLPIISRISEIVLTQAEQGYAMNFPGRDTWPGVVPPGWEGPINHTLWMGEYIHGQWYVLPVKEGLHDYLTLGPILTPGHIAENLTYYAQPPMVGYNPRPGERLAYFVTTGDTRRMNLQPPTMMGRSNVVLVPLAAGTYTWGAR
jgi:hypothetical protein